MRPDPLLLPLFTVLVSCSAPDETGKDDSTVQASLDGTILFLGDSITHAGHYVSDIEAVLRSRGSKAELINLGLPSETCTGLSEPDHPFPRPNVHDRIDDALRIVKPNLVFACYGMNDGIYHPFSEERFAAYQEGIEKIIEKVHASGARLILMTPPPFDPEPLRAKGKLKPAGEENYAWFEIYENYDTEVMARYADWILEQRERVEGVIDLRSPLLAYTTGKRTADPDFTLSNDGVHINAEGHGIAARAILEALGDDPAALDGVDSEQRTLIGKRQKLLHDAWLSHVGHTRPQVRPGLPLDTARIAAELIDGENPVSLFNGVDLKGWEGDESIWSVEDGEIVGRNEGEVPSSTYLFSGKKYRNFRLLFDVKQTVSKEHSTMHSAAAVLGERFTDKGENGFGFKGPLLMFCHDWGIWDAYRRNRIEPAGQKGALRIEGENTGDWNRCEVLVIGNRIRFVANGSLVFDFTDQPEMLQPSPIGLQIHSNKRPQEFRFRGIVVSEDPADRLVTLVGPNQ
jgi:lysophospholipase L1-like esterase